MRDGNLTWLCAAAGAEVLSYAGYVVLLRAVFGRVVGWRESFLITMAGVAATRLFATAGAGGIVLTTWALRRLGLPARDVGRGMVAFLATLYTVYMAALLVLGIGLGTGLLAGAAAFHAFGTAPAAAVLLMSYFVGMLGNLLPLPGGVGGVEGGMIGALVAFGEPAGPAVVAVLGYRLVSFWLPTLIGAPAYVALVRRRAEPEESPGDRRRRSNVPAASTR